MGAIFQSLGRTVTAGVVVLLVIIGLVAALSGGVAVSAQHAWVAFFFRWLHVLSGVMWIGLLWYFNFVQVPTMPKVPAELKGGVTGYIAPAALFYFRWAAMATIILGIGLASMNHYLVQAYTLDAVDGFTNTAFVLIGIGMWLGTIMWFNVWFVIWPNQQKVLNIGGKGDGLSAEAKAAAGKAALIASRFNTMASIPMLFCMVAASHI